MKRNEILGEHKKGVKAVKYNKKPKDPVADYTKAKEKLKPVKPMEGYNPNSASAEHRRKLDQSHAADLKAKATSPDATERDKQRYQNYLDKKEQMANDYNDRMEREGIEQEALYRRRGSSSAYDRDYRSSVSGMGKHDSLAYQLDGGANDEGWDEEEPRQRRYEPAADVPHDVYIDGRKWKTFDSASHARNVARKLEAKGKNVTVKASSTEEAMGDEVGKITKVDPATKKATLTKADGTSMEVDSTALKPTPDGKMQMDAPDLKTGTSVVSTEGMDSAPPTDSTSPIHGGQEKVDLRRLRELAGQPVAPTTDDGEYDAIDSAESYKAWLQKSAAADGLSPEQSAELVNMTVTDEDGSIDMDATMVNAMKGLADLMPQLLVMFTEWVAVLEKAKADQAQWSTLTPEEQKSIDEAIAEGKARLPELEANVKQMQAQMPELDKAMADRKAAGTTMKIPSKAPVEEGTAAGKDLGNGFILTTTEFGGKNVPAVFDSQDNAYWIQNDSGDRRYGMSLHIQIKNGKADGKVPGRQTAAAMKAAGWEIAEPKQREPKPTDTSASEPHVPKDYQTREPLTKGPDGKWRNSKGEERDGLHGGPVNNGAAMFRSMTRTPTQESTELTAMLRIAGLR